MIEHFYHLDFYSEASASPVVVGPVHKNALYMQHLLVAREHKKVKRRKAKGADAEPEPVVEGDEVDESNQDRGLLISYCSLDYQRFFDMARLRMFKIRQTLKSELEDK